MRNSNEQPFGRWDAPTQAIAAVQVYEGGKPGVWRVEITLTGDGGTFEAETSNEREPTGAECRRFFFNFKELFTKKETN